MYIVGLVIILIGFAIAFLLWPKTAVGVSAPAVTESPKTSVEDLIFRASLRWGVEAALIKAHIQVESSFNPNATNSADPSYGLMGITPICAQDFGYVVDWRNPTKDEIAALYDPKINIEIGTRFLKKLHDKYEFDVATQMYNCGEYNYNNKHVRVPEYLSKIKGYYDEFRT